MSIQSPNKDYSSTGNLFSHVYLERGAAVQDSKKFRTRLSTYIHGRYGGNGSAGNYYDDMAQQFAEDAAIVIDWRFNGRDFSGFFMRAPIAEVLDAVTLVWRFLSKNKNRSTNGSESMFFAAERWKNFVSKALEEENLRYRLDVDCGVHLFVDEEFERNRASALGCLDLPRYAGVRDAFEKAHEYLDTQSPDTKAAVRSAFEAIEVLARLIVPATRNLNKWLLHNTLKDLAVSYAEDVTEKNTYGHIFNGLGEIVEGLHNYRHGQPEEEPVSPSLDLAIYVVSTTASVLRVLVSIDAKEGWKGKEVA